MKITLLEMAAAVGVVLAAGALLVYGCGVAGEGGRVQVSAENQAATYAQNMGYQDPHVQCVTWDSDGDGYVSCTVAFAQPNGTLGKDVIECAAGFNVRGAFNSGCRAPKLGVVRP